MNDLPTNWFCLGLCALAVVAGLGFVWLVTRNVGAGSAVDDAHERNLAELPEIDGGRRG